MRAVQTDRLCYSSLREPRPRQLLLRRGALFDEDFHGLAVAFAALGEPFAHGGGEALRIDSEPGFELAFAGGESVVKLARAGEVSHAEGVEPLERNGPALASDHGDGGEFAGIHRR